MRRRGKSRKARKKCGREVRVRTQPDRAAYKLFHSGRGEKRFLKIRQVKKNEEKKKKRNKNKENWQKKTQRNAGRGNQVYSGRSIIGNSKLRRPRNYGETPLETNVIES